MEQPISASRTRGDLPSTRRDLLLAPVFEAALILIAALAAWKVHRPLLFASLGPTAYELVETPGSPTARPYNIIVGHLIGVLSGFAALFLTHAASSPGVATGDVSLPRVAAAGMAAMLTVLGTLLAKATQPAAVSTALVISLGSMQRLEDAPIIMVAILLITALGEPLRRWRSRNSTRDPEAC